jgi:hypothetical protein
VNLASRVFDKHSKSIRIAGCLVCFIIILFSICYCFYKTGSIITADSEYDLIRQATIASEKDPLVDKNLDSKLSSFLRPLLFFGEEKAILIIQLALLSICIFVIFKSKGINDLFPLVLGISPSFVFAFGVLSDITLSVTIGCLVYYFIYNDKYYVAMAFNIFLSIINPYFGFLIGIFIVVKFMRKELSGWITIAFILPCLLFMRFGKIIGIDFGKMISVAFSEFGTPYGLSIVACLIGIVSLYLHWEMFKESRLLFFVSIAIVFIDAKSGILLLSIFLAYFSSVMLRELIRDNWDIELLKDISIYLIICGILFSSLSAIHTEGRGYEVRSSMIPALDWLESGTMREGTVLSLDTYGEEIKYFSRHAVVLDSASEEILNFKEKREDVNKIFQSRNLNLTRTLLSRYDIKYILITEDMLHGLVWKKDDEGLLYLIESTDYFNKIYDLDGIQIFEYFASGEK